MKKDEAKYAVLLDTQDKTYLRVGYAENGDALLINNNGKTVELVQMDAASLKSRDLKPVANASIRDSVKSYLKPLNTSVILSPRAEQKLLEVLNDKELIAMPKKKAATSATSSKSSAKAAKTSKAAKAAKSAAASNGRVRKNARFSPDQKITVLAKENPGREGTKRRDWFDLYAKKKTVGAYLDAGGDRGYLQYDVNHGNIKIQ